MPAAQPPELDLLPFLRPEGDTWRLETTRAAVAASMATHQVTLIIDAFHGNTDRCVALNAERP